MSESDAAEAGITLDVAESVATITLNRPARHNAMTYATWHELARIGETLPRDVRVVVIKGEGPSFSAGIDRAMFGGDFLPALVHKDDADIEEFISGLQAAYRWLRRPEIVSIAAVQGHAIGGGFQLALSCDLRILADDAQLCMKEPALGIVPDLTGTKPLVEIVGVARAIELCLTARTIDAGEAARLGLAELVVPRAELDGAVSDLVAALLEVNHGAATATKRLLREATDNTLDEQCAAERREQVARLRELFG